MKTFMGLLFSIYIDLLICGELCPGGGADKTRAGDSMF
jgi:hypothetical protein